MGLRHRLLPILFSLCLYASPANAAEERQPDAYGATFTSMKENVIYSLVQKNAANLKAKMNAHPLQNQAVAFVLGKSATGIVDHYLGMVDFLSENMPSDSCKAMKQTDCDKKDVGSAFAGYVIARTYYSKNDVAALDEKMPKAFAYYEEKKGDVSWEDWVKQFDGDTAMALKAIGYRSMWVRWGLKYGRPDMNSISTFYGNMGVDGMHPFKKDAFGLDLSSQYNLDTMNPGWGKSYKTIAGMNLAFAAKNKGYSDDDIKKLVSRAGLLYESSDFLYDHLGIARKEIHQYEDSNSAKKNPELQLAYKKFAERVREALRKDPALLKKLIGSVFGSPETGKFIPDGINLSTDDDLVLIFLLLNYSYESTTGFESDFGPLFGEDKNGKLLKNLFLSGISDTQIMVKGADFVLDKLKPVPIAELNPCLKEMPFQGIFAFEKQIQGILANLK